MITSYDKLPIGKYLEACEVSSDKTRDGIARTVGYISILADMSEDEVLQLSLDEFSKLARQTAFLVEDAKPVTVASSYKLGNWELEPVHDYRKMTAGQYIDFQALAKDPSGHLVDLLAVFLVPKGMKYGDGYDIEEVKTAIKDMLPVTAAMALQAFFLTSLRDSIRDSLISSEKALKCVRNPEKRKMLRAQIAELRRSLKNGDGFGLSTKLAKQPASTGTQSLK